MPDVSPGYVKGLFHHLVKACGGVEAVGAFLDVSHQHISNLQNVNTSAIPNMLVIAKLEAWCGQPVVSSALSKRCAVAPQDYDVAKETRDVTYAAVDVQRAVDAGASRRDVEALVLKLERELSEARAALETLDPGDDSVTPFRKSSR